MPKLKALERLSSKVADRFARAEKMGFDTSRTYYHGTRGDIKAFDPKLAGAHTARAGQTPEEGVIWFAAPERRQYASYFAEQGNKNRAQLELLKKNPKATQKQLDALKDVPVEQLPGRPELLKKYSDELKLVKNKAAEEGVHYSKHHGYSNVQRVRNELMAQEALQRSSGANVLPVHLKTEKTFVFDPEKEAHMRLLDRLEKQNPQKNYKDVAALIPYLKKKGYDSIRRADEQSVGVFKPNQIRSIWAEFDPKKAGSSKISAGLGGAAILGGAMAAGASEAEASGGKMPKLKTLKRLAEKAALGSGEAERVARAEKIGFDTKKTWFHGSAADINKFDLSRSGSSSEVDSGAVFFSDNPKVAERFADYAANGVMDRRLDHLVGKSPGYLKLKKDFDAGKIDFNALTSGRSLIKEEMRGADSVIYPSFLKTKNPKTVDMGDTTAEASDPTFIARLVDSAKKQGHDSLLLKNVIDEPGMKIRSNVVAVFKPEQIRSKYAAFDPKKAKSGNIAAGLGGSAIIGGGLAAPGEAQASEDHMPKEKNMSRNEMLAAAEAKFERDSLMQMAEAHHAAQTYSGPGLPEQVETGLRSAASSATLGLSEPAVSAANALVGQGIEAAFAEPGNRLAQFSPGSLKAAYHADAARRQGLESELPGTALAGEIAGALSPIGPAAAAFRAGSGIASGIKGAGALSKIARGAAGAGAGMGLASVGEEAVRGLTGFSQPQDVGVGAQAGQAALAGGALASLPVAGKGLGSLGQSAFASAFGIRKEVIPKFLANAERIKGAKGIEEIKDVAQMAVSELKRDAEIGKLNLVDEIQAGLEGLKGKISQASAESYDILGQSGVQVAKSELLLAVDRARKGLMIKGVAPTGEAAKSAVAKLDNFRNSLEALPDQLDASDVKQIVQQIDQDVSYIQTPGVYEDNIGQRALKSIRHEIDQSLKGRIPEYAAKMAEVSNMSQLLSESAKRMGGHGKAFSSLTQLGKPGKPIQDSVLKQFAKSQGVDLERFRQAQETADLFNAWTEGTMQNKVQALMSGKNIEVRRAFEQLSQMSGQDFVQLAEDARIRSSFESEFLRGSRNVNLWTILGASGGYLNTGDIVFGAGGGAAIGALMDKHGPKMAQKILEGVAGIQGMPTVRKISQLSLPDQVKEELRGSFIRAYVESRDSDKPFFVPQENRAEVRQQIIDLPELSAIEKAREISALNKTGEISVMRRILESSGKKIERKPAILPKPSEKPEGEPGAKLKNVSDFVRRKKAEDI